MASNFPSSNSDDEKVELKKHIESVFTISSPSSDELDARKHTLLERNLKLKKFTRPRKETVLLPGGEVRKIDLIYNTKTENDSKSHKSYKTSLCRFYKTPGSCIYGSSCTFAHSLEELIYFNEIVQKFYDEAKKETAHHEPCRNQQCPIRLRLLLRNTVICKYWEEDNCRRSDNLCDYAHGEAQLNPLPKYEMCKNFQRGACGLKNTECVYAHNYGEKRPKEAIRIQEPAAAELCTNCQWLRMMH